MLITLGGIKAPIPGPKSPFLQKNNPQIATQVLNCRPFYDFEAYHTKNNGRSPR
jgi:hypothetical protein